MRNVISSVNTSIVAKTSMSTSQTIHAYWVSTSNSFSFARAPLSKLAGRMPRRGS